MTLKILQLNCYACTYFPELKKFLQNSDFDILAFQEVSGKHTYVGNIHSDFDNFQSLQEVLRKDYYGELAKADTFTSDSINSYMANAIFYRKNFKLLEKHIVWLYKKDTPFPSEKLTFEDQGRNALDLKLSLDNQAIHILTCHLAWAKTSIEQPHQRQQNKKLVEYISKLSAPFIVTGDFNIQPDQPTIQKLEQYAINLTKKYKIINTLNEREHRAKMLFPPGVAVDYIFVSPEVTITKFEVLENVQVSDHLGLTATVEI